VNVCFVVSLVAAVLWMCVEYARTLAGIIDLSAVIHGAGLPNLPISTESSLFWGPYYDHTIRQGKHPIFLRRLDTRRPSGLPANTWPSRIRVNRLVVTMVCTACSVFSRRVYTSNSDDGCWHETPRQWTCPWSTQAPVVYRPNDSTCCCTFQFSVLIVTE